jgi:hypothetical protein
VLKADRGLLDYIIDIVEFFLFDSTGMTFAWPEREMSLDRAEPIRENGVSYRRPNRGYLFTGQAERSGHDRAFYREGRFGLCYCEIRGMKQMVTRRKSEVGTTKTGTGLKRLSQANGG